MKLFFIALILGMTQTSYASINPLSQAKAAQAPSLFTQTVALANQNNAQAQYHLGMLLNNGMGGANKDPAQAFSWFQKAASNGDVLAQYKVGCYYAGQFATETSIAVDHELAMKFKLMAANGDYALAQYDVALMYLKQKDWKQTAYWSKRAADQGELMAILFYASLVSNPLFEQYDPLTAWVYGKIASTMRHLDLQSGQSQTATNLQADKKLQAFLDKLDANFTPEQRETAQRKTTEWQAQPSAITVEAKRGIEALKVLLGDPH